MKTEIKKIGEFTVLSDKLVVSDPCYDLDTWCKGILENVKKGKWKAEVTISDEDNWGKRVAELFVHHPESHIVDYKQCSFEVGVDSGQAGVYDYPIFEKKELKEPYLKVGYKEYDDRETRHFIEQWRGPLTETQELVIKTKKLLNEDTSKEEQKLSEIGQKIDEYKKHLDSAPETTTDWYEMCCDKTLGNQKAGVIPGGVVSSSGFGDGGYRAEYGVDQDGQVCAVRIFFIEEEDHFIGEGGEEEEE